MGCGVAKRSELELRLNEFTNYLNIRNIKDTKYAEVVRNAYNNGDKSVLKERVIEYLSISRKSNYSDLVPHLHAYVRSLNNSDFHLLVVSLLFLSITRPVDLKQNFVLLKETFKNELPNYDNDYKFAQTVLRFYFLFVSKEILRIYKTKGVALGRNEAQQVPKLEARYTEPVVESLIASYTQRSATKFTLEEFINSYFDHFTHENVRDELKLHYKSNPKYGYIPKNKRTVVQNTHYTTSHPQVVQQVVPQVAPQVAPAVVSQGAPKLVSSRNPSYVPQNSSYVPQNTTYVSQNQVNLQPSVRQVSNIPAGAVPISPSKYPNLVNRGFSPSRNVNVSSQAPLVQSGLPNKLVSSGYRNASPSRYGQTTLNPEITNYRPVVYDATAPNSSVNYPSNISLDGSTVRINETGRTSNPSINFPPSNVVLDGNTVRVPETGKFTSPKN